MLQICQIEENVVENMPDWYFCLLKNYWIDNSVGKKSDKMAILFVKILQIEDFVNLDLPNWQIFR